MQNSNPNSATPPPQPAEVVEHLFRHEAGKIVAVLTGIFGVEHLGLAEDVVQETLANALQTWPYYGIPQNPAAWIMRAAKNLALDAIRREANFRRKQEQIIQFFEHTSEGADEASFETEIRDERLRLIFVCCHPVVPEDAQVALALRTLCGFSTAEIAKAFLTTEAALAKKLTRAKQQIREEGVRYEIPRGSELAQRLDAVLQTLYLLFNEGYRASGGAQLVRTDLCEEAIRLTSLVAEHTAGNQPKTHALLALMLLNAARLPTRLDGDGNLLRLSDQDRAQWNKAMIACGLQHLARSAAGDELSVYHLQAGIAACHCTAADYESTDWQHILSLYDRLAEIDASPIVALNRAIALGKVHGAKAALEAIKSIQRSDKLRSYSLLYAALGEFETQLNNSTSAVEYFQRALELTEIPSERAFLTERLRACDTTAPQRAKAQHEAAGQRA